MTSALSLCGALALVQGRKTYAEVCPGIYIGSCGSVENDEFLQNEKIELIINASNRNYPLTKLSIPTLQVIDIEDIVPFSEPQAQLYRADILSKAKSVAEQMHKYVASGRNVLVHCFAGVNRSAFIIAVYLITKMNFTSEAAIEALSKANSEQRNTEVLSNPLLRSIVRELEYETQYYK